MAVSEETPLLHTRRQHKQKTKVSPVRDKIAVYGSFIGEQDT